MAKTYLISGAGSGIGRAIAQKLSSDGHKCILLGRNADKLHQTLQSLSNGAHIMLTADTKDKEKLPKPCSFTKLGGITIDDGLIANSGIGGENYWGDNDRWHDIIETNLTGTYNFVNTFFAAYLSKVPGRKAHTYHVIDFGTVRRSQLFGLLCLKGRLAWFNALVGSAICARKHIGECHLPRLG